MRVSQHVPSVWPGYVAAIASLVLSLLLLLAILVFALTQVGNFVSAYTQELLRETLQSAQSQTSAKALPQPAQPQHITRLPPLAVQSPSEPVAPGTPLRQVRLLFGADLADIPAAQLSEVAAAIKQTQAPDDAPWLIWANVLSGDVLMERSTYRLMLAVRKSLVAQGVSEKQVQLQIKTVTTPPSRYQQGEIIIYVAPLHLKSPERGKP